MKIARAILYLLIRCYTWPLRFALIMKLSFQKVRRKEFWKYYDEVFLNDYPHIRRACNYFIEEPEPVIFDVGGGQGTTLEIFSKQLPQAHIELFEPIHSNFEIIQKKFGQNQKIKLHNLAAGDIEGKSIIHIADRVTSSSLFELNPEAHQKDSYLASALKFEREEEIEVIRLSKFIEPLDRVDLLKLDVQGFELNVLKGCGNALSKVRYILLEVSNHDGYKGAAQYYEIDAFLRLHNFEIADLFPGIKENGFLREWDCIYLNKLWK